MKVITQDKHRLVTQEEVEQAVLAMAVTIIQAFPDGIVRIYPVPRGGYPPAYLLLKESKRFELTTDLNDADVVVDDIVDSGRIRDRIRSLRSVPFYSMAAFLERPRSKNEWLVFPWETNEGSAATDTSGDDIVLRLLQYVGEDPTREGLLETPKRVLKAWKEWTAGYGQDPKSVLKVFADGGEKYDQMLVQRDLPFYSHCEHHLAPFFGTATIAYIPNGKIVGLSKLGRVLHIYSRRLQVQERLTNLVADSLYDHLAPKGVGVLIKARHLCMESRGLSVQGAFTTTSALRGEFLDDPKVRAEFLSLSGDRI